MTVQFGAGRAEMHVKDLALRDQIRVPIALGPDWATAGDPAVVSFDVVWSPPITRRVSVTDGTNGNHYAGDYVENQATVTWSGTNLATGFTFTSNPGDFSTSVPGRAFAELGHEGNGSFFDAGSTASVPGRAFAELSHEGNGLFVGSGSTAAQEAGARAGTGLAPALVAWASPRATTATTLLARPQPADGDPTRAVGSAHVILVAPGPDRSEAEAAHPKALDQVFADLAGSTLWDPFGGHEVRAGDI